MSPSSQSKKNCIFLPGLVPSNIGPFINILSALSGKVNVIVVTEQDCISYLDKIRDFPNLFVYSIGELGLADIQKKQAKTTRLYQWYKFNCCLRLLKQIEDSQDFTANKIFKLRFDYLYQNPHSLVDALLDNSSVEDDLLFCESDRVFFGSRLTVFSLRHFLDLAVALFLNKIDYYYPLHVENLKKSSLNVTRWERVNFDRRVFDCPSIQQLYTEPKYLNSFLSTDSLPLIPPSPTDIYSFHTGNHELPAERSFAWYLNVHGIIARDHPAMSGGIYRSR